MLIRNQPKGGYYRRRYADDRIEMSNDSTATQQQINRMGDKNMYPGRNLKFDDLKDGVYMIMRAACCSCGPGKIYIRPITPTPEAGEPTTRVFSWGTIIECGPTTTHSVGALRRP